MGGMDDIVEARPARRFPAIALVGAGLVGGLVLAGLTAASAQTSPAPTPSAAPDGKPFGGQRGKHHGGHGLKGMRGALHGEFTTRAPGGGFQTMAMQHGEATAVSATSITVKSEDGFSRTYAVGDDTLVNAGDEGIADVSTGDTVHVLAVVKDGTASAVRVVDATTTGRIRDRWRPGKARPSGEPSAAT